MRDVKVKGNELVVMIDYLPSYGTATRVAVRKFLKNAEEGFSVLCDRCGIVHSYRATFNDDGSIKIGCTTFNKATVARVKKWAFATKAKAAPKRAKKAAR